MFGELRFFAKGRMLECVENVTPSGNNIINLKLETVTRVLMQEAEVYSEVRAFDIVLKMIIPIKETTDRLG